jgi:hypothetical protein
MKEFESGFVGLDDFFDFHANHNPKNPLMPRIQI